MALYFWRVLDKYRERFLSLAGIQDIDFDPMVNKYLEAENTYNGQTIGSGTSIGTSKGRNYGDTQTIASGNGNSSDTGTVTNAGEYSDNKTLDERRETGGEDKRVLNMTDTETKSGTDTETKTLNLEDKRTPDLTSDQTTNETNNNTQVVNNTVATDGRTSEDSRTRQADKAAPMSAVNLAMTQGSGDAQLPGGHLGDMDFTFASAYSQRDGGAINKTDKTETTDGTTTDNGGSYTVNNRHDSGNETTTRTGTDTTATEYGSQTTTTHGGSETTEYGKTETLTGSDNETGNSSSTRTDDLSHEWNDKSTRQEQRDLYNDVTTSKNDKSQQNKTSTNRNRYTGREGLTPQEGLRTAEDYLRKYGPAIDFLISKLEICFIGIYDI